MRRASLLSGRHQLSRSTHRASKSKYAHHRAEVLHVPVLANVKNVRASGVELVDLRFKCVIHRLRREKAREDGGERRRSSVRPRNNSKQTLIDQLFKGRRRGVAIIMILGEYECQYAKVNLRKSGVRGSGRDHVGLRLWPSERVRVSRL